MTSTQAMRKVDIALVRTSCRFFTLLYYIIHALCYNNILAGTLNNDIPISDPDKIYRSMPGQMSRSKNTSGTGVP